jgi:hypothetical protein
VSEAASGPTGGLDRLLGTAYLPAARWPTAYGIEGHPVPEGYWRQLAWPFRV